MIATYLQVLSVLVLICAGAAALGNEVRLWIDERHADREQARAGRHAVAASAIHDGVHRAVIKAAHRIDTALLFAEAREAFESAAPTVRMAAP